MRRINHEKWQAIDLAGHNTASDPLANIRSLEDVRNIRIVIQDGRLVKG